MKLRVFTFNCSATVKLQHCMRKRIRVSSAKCLRNAARRLQRKQNSRTCFAFLTTLRQTFFSLYRWKHRVPHTSNASLMQYHAHGAVNKYITSLLSARNFCRGGDRPMFVLKTAEANELQIKLLFSFFSSTNSSRKTAVSHYKGARYCHCLCIIHTQLRDLSGTSRKRTIENWHNSNRKFVCNSKWLNRLSVALRLECDPTVTRLERYQPATALHFLSGQPKLIQFCFDELGPIHRDLIEIRETIKRWNSSSFEDCFFAQLSVVVRWFRRRLRARLKDKGVCC